MPSPAPSFTLSGWSAWNPALTDAAAWLDWAARDEALPQGDGAPALAAMPPLLRRRAHRLGRMALETLYGAAPGDDCVVVHASRHGEVERSLALLQSLAADGSVSPQHFGMAVHNAIPGLFTIARQLPLPVSAVAAGRATIWAALVEALGQLADGAPRVLLVMADEPVPPLFTPFTDEPEAPFAYTLALTPGDDWHLDWAASDAGDCADNAAPGVLRAVLTGRGYAWQSQGRRWRLEPGA
ncbi:beta-ketoacyl synthase chain length factor [Chitiniphilus eburneus]|uniref:3-oxoacyl-ACP synthase n=1 Tax=Chitiniphilus eburneus TaxID=2571148 RepID=A0A4U0PFH9_9NEIS|nr:beta-ketoacyl synthase chain length factor [Chitiniphilus eburneus]TJZ65822.1 3-oxoacyl-ACP synthase [Chitiniphilus eburneus]